jgi:peptide/nickel transport system substrate-binding protein
MMLAACSSSGKSGGGTTNTSGNTTANTPDTGKPVEGGKLTYALEAETDGGFCLSNAQLVVSGEQIATSIYDTLTVIDSKGKYEPFLAKTVTPNADSSAWTITLRTQADGSPIKFQDGTDLTPAIVADNINAWIGKYVRPDGTHAPSLLFAIVLKDVTSVTSDATSVTVKLDKSWPSFPWVLYANGRLGIMAKAQLDSSDADCANKNLIGTGPFSLVSWKPNQSMVLKKNPNYWRTDKDGQKLPYLDQITFVPVPDSTQRTNGLGEVYDALAQSTFTEIGKLETAAKAGTYNIAQEKGDRELRYYLLNARRAPFNDLLGREAVTYAINPQEVNGVINNDLATVAKEPFDIGTDGYTANSQWPGFNLAKAKTAVAAYKAKHGGTFPTITLLTDNDSAEAKEAGVLIGDLSAAGIPAKQKPVTQSQIVNTAIGGDFDLLLWRNHPGGDPDSQYVWWWNSPAATPTVNANLVNFGAFHDDTISSLLDTGRSQTPGTPERSQTYEKVVQQFSKNLWNIWMWYEDWTIAGTKKVHGFTGGTLPAGGTQYPILGGLIRADNLWVTK